MIERLYLDTSVFGGYFEPEFEAWTRLLFEKIYHGEYKVVYSQLTANEIEPAPPLIKDLVKTFNEKIVETIAISDEAEFLAEQYLLDKVVGKLSRPDCLHIALATLSTANFLVSWNFKHIVNVNRIKGYKAVNQRLNLKHLEILSPQELLRHEN